MKHHSIISSLNCLQNTKTSVIEERHQMKYDDLIMENRIRDGIHQNPNKMITNLINIGLSNDEISVLELYLKHDVLIQLKTPEIIATVENIWK